SPPEVVQGEGELAAEMVGQQLAVFFVQVDEDLGVGARPKTLAEPGEIVSQALKSVELAVERDQNRLVLVGDRLTAAVRVDDGEAGVEEDRRAVSARPVAPLIRPPVSKRADHRLDRLEAD